MPLFTVPSSGVYRSADGKDVRQFTAGDRIDLTDAIRFGMSGAVLPAVNLFSDDRRSEIAAVAQSVDPVTPGDLSLTTNVLFGGDSITSKAGVAPLWADVGYASWFYLLGNGKYRRVDHVSGGGRTTQQYIDELLPTLLSRITKGMHVGILLGTNDAGGSLTPAQTIANLIYIWGQIRLRGGIPIAMSIPPRTDALTKVHAINDLIYRYAQANGILYVDLHAVLTDPATGGYLSGYGEALATPIHPAAPGAKVMGQAIVTVLDKVVRPMDPPLIQTQADPGSMVIAPLFLAGFTDGNGDSLPDTVSGKIGWSLVSGFGNVDVSYANASGGDVVGRWLELTLNASAPATGFTMSPYSNAFPAVNPGDRLAFGFKAKMSGSGAGTNLGIWLSKGNSSSSYLTGDSFPLYNWSQDFGPNTVYGECVVPVGYTTLRCSFGMSGVVGQKLSLGQIHIKNLTQLAIA